MIPTESVRGPSDSPRPRPWPVRAAIGLLRTLTPSEDTRLALLLLGGLLALTGAVGIWFFLTGLIAFRLGLGQSFPDAAVLGVAVQFGVGTVLYLGWLLVRAVRRSMPEV